jgi:hypothetical protein
VAPGTNRRVLSPGDELALRQIIKECHAEQFENCGRTFVAKESYGASFWMKVTLIVSVCLAVLAYFITDHTTIATTAASVDKMQSDKIDKVSKDIAERDSVIKENSAAFREILKRMEKQK